MDELAFNILDTGNNEELVEYQKCLFNAFSKNTRIMAEYELVANNQLKSDIPYDRYEIFVARRSGNIVAGLGINNQKEYMRCLKKGFSINDTSYCEAINWFNIDDRKYMGAAGYSLLLHVFNMIKNKYENLYAYSGNKLVKFYELQGFKAIDQIAHEEDILHLLKININGFLSERQ